MDSVSALIRKLNINVMCQVFFFVQSYANSSSISFYCPSITMYMYMYVSVWPILCVAEYIDFIPTQIRDFENSRAIF